MREPAWKALRLVLPLVLGASLALAAEPSLMFSDVYDGGLLQNDVGTAVVVDPDGNLLVGGESTDLDGASDLFVRKLSGVDHSELWSARWGDPGGNDMALMKLAISPRGDVFVGGYVRGCVG